MEDNKNLQIVTGILLFAAFIFILFVVYNVFELVRVVEEERGLRKENEYISIIEESASSEPTGTSQNIGSNEREVYSISYDISPKVTFLDESSEIVSFRTALPSNFVIQYWEEGKESEAREVSQDEYTNFHEAVLTELEPGKKYYYRVRVYTENGGYNESFSSYFYALSRENDTFSFAVIGDNRPKTGFEMPDEFHRIIYQIRGKSPNFVMTVGDNVQLADISDLSRDDALEAWKMYARAVSSVSVNTPFYVGMGNHDKPGNEDALEVFRSVWSFPHNGGGLDEYFDETVYAFSYGNAKFIMLNSYFPGYHNELGLEQTEWLDNELRKATEDHIFVFTHHPIQGSTRSAYSNSNELHRMFVEYGVTAVFQGHDHVFCHYEQDGIRYITTGGAGSPLYKDLCVGKEISEYHYVLIDVKESDVFMTAISDTGRTISREALSP